MIRRTLALLTFALSCSHATGPAATTLPAAHVAPSPDTTATEKLARLLKIDGHAVAQASLGKAGGTIGVVVGSVQNVVVSGDEAAPQSTDMLGELPDTPTFRFADLDGDGRTDVVAASLAEKNYIVTLGPDRGLTETGAEIAAFGAPDLDAAVTAIRALGAGHVTVAEACRLMTAPIAGAMVFVGWPGGRWTLKSDVLAPVDPALCAAQTTCAPAAMTCVFDDVKTNGVAVTVDFFRDPKGKLHADRIADYLDN